MTKTKFALAAVMGMLALCVSTASIGSPICPDGEALKPDAKYASAKWPKLGGQQPIPSCGVNTPCTAQQLAAGPVKCTVAHKRPMAMPKGTPSKFSKPDPDDDVEVVSKPSG